MEVSIFLAILLYRYENCIVILPTKPAGYLFIEFWFEIPAVDLNSELFDYFFQAKPKLFSKIIFFLLFFSCFFSLNSRSMSARISVLRIG